ncbi:HNH endonuclease [Leptospira interrogans]
MQPRPRRAANFAAVTTTSFTPLPLEGGNFSEHAHIYPFSQRGPRSDEKERPGDIYDAANFMLLCKPCHDLVDDKPAKYNVEVLRAMKQEHEQRMRLQNAVQADKATHIVRFGANIGTNEALSSLPDMQEALFPHRYPASIDPIDLELVGSRYKDHEPEYWHFQQENLRRQFALNVGRRIERGDARHFSVFTLAPQQITIERPDVIGYTSFPYHQCSVLKYLKHAGILLVSFASGLPC